MGFACAQPHPRLDASPVERGILDHPLHQFAERDAGIGSELGNERGLGHAGLRVDLKADQSRRSAEAIVVTEIRATDAAAAERAMRGRREPADLLVDLRCNLRWQNMPAAARRVL